MTEPRRKMESFRVLMIGKGWFPEQTGGLDRYFRELFEQLPEARAVAPLWRFVGALVPT